MLSVAWLSCTAAVARPVAGVAGVAGVIPLPAASSLMRKVHPPRCNLKMQYGGGGGGSFDQQGYSYGAQQEEYAAQQNYGTQPNFGAEVVWTLHGSPGVKGFLNAEAALTKSKSDEKGAKKQALSVPSSASEKARKVRRQKQIATTAHQKTPF